MKNLFFALVAFGLVGCNDVAGTLNVQQSFTAVTKGGLFKRAQEVQIPAGQHSIELSGSLGGDLTIKMSLNGRNEKIRMDIPRKGYNTRDGRFPTENGRFDLLSQQLKQPFDIRGEVQTTYEDGPLRRDREYCQYPRDTRVCEIDPDTKRRTCHTETEYVTGEREVEYFNRSELKRISFVVYPASQRNGVADFVGHDNSEYKKYTYEGRCYPRW